jgi:hypothetical protein
MAVLNGVHGVMGFVRAAGPLRVGDKLCVFLPDQAPLPLCSGLP